MKNLTAAIAVATRSAATMDIPSYVYEHSPKMPDYNHFPNHEGQNLYQVATVEHTYLGSRAAHVVAVVMPDGTVIGKQAD